MRTSFKKLFFDRQGHSLKESFIVIYLMIRRLCYWKFRQKYVEEMVKKRKGSVPAALVVIYIFGRSLVST